MPTAATLVGSFVPLAQKPNTLTVCPGAMRAPQPGGATDTWLPLCATVPFHELVNEVPWGSAKVSFQVVIALVPVFVIRVLRQNPLPHVESFTS